MGADEYKEKRVREGDGAAEVVARRCLMGLRKTAPSQDNVMVDETISPLQMAQYSPQAIYASAHGGMYKSDVQREVEVVGLDANRLGVITRGASNYDVFGLQGGFEVGKLLRIKYDIKYASKTINITELEIWDRDPLDSETTELNRIFQVTNIALVMPNTAGLFETIYDRLLELPFETEEESIYAEATVGGLNQRLWILARDPSPDDEKHFLIHMVEGGRT